MVPSRSVLIPVIIITMELVVAPLEDDEVDLVVVLEKILEAWSLMTRSHPPPLDPRDQLGKGGKRPTR